MWGSNPEAFMRFFPFALIAGLLLAPLVARAEDGMCEYRSPSHPNWDFFASCHIDETRDGAVTTRRVTVSNGSKFTTVEGGASASVNGLDAATVARDDARCWQTTAAQELVCLYPPQATAPDEPRSVPGTGGAGSDALDTGFGGGSAGYCLIAKAGALVEQGACVRRENCLDLETGGLSCLAGYDWASGRVTEYASAKDWQTLDGAPAINGDAGCLVDTGGGITFCFSAKPMTADTYPLLAAPDENKTPAAAGPVSEGEDPGTAATGE